MTIKLWSHDLKMNMEKITSVIIDMTANITGTLQLCLASDITDWQCIFTDNPLTQL